MIVVTLRDTGFRRFVDAWDALHPAQAGQADYIKPPAEFDGLPIFVVQVDGVDEPNPRDIDINLIAALAEVEYTFDGPLWVWCSRPLILDAETPTAELAVEKYRKLFIYGHGG